MPSFNGPELISAKQDSAKKPKPKTPSCLGSIPEVLRVVNQCSSKAFRTSRRVRIVVV